MDIEIDFSVIYSIIIQLNINPQNVHILAV